MRIMNDDMCLTFLAMQVVYINLCLALVAFHFGFQMRMALVNPHLGFQMRMYLVDLQFRFQMWMVSVRNDNGRIHGLNFSSLYIKF